MRILRCYWLSSSSYYKVKFSRSYVMSDDIIALILTCNGFIIATFQWINKSLKFISLNLYKVNMNNYPVVCWCQPLLAWESELLNLGSCVPVVKTLIAWNGPWWSIYTIETSYHGFFSEGWLNSTPYCILPTQAKTLWGGPQHFLRV